MDIDPDPHRITIEIHTQLNHRIPLSVSLCVSRDVDDEVFGCPVECGYHMVVEDTDGGSHTHSFPCIIYIS